MATLVERYQEGLRRIRVGASAAVEQAWDGLGSYDEADVPAFFTAALPVVGASQAAAVALTDAYVATEAGRSPLGLDPTEVAGAAARNGAAPEDVYRRPFVQVWSALGEGRPWEEAVAAGRLRAATAATTDVALAARAATRATAMRDSRITGWQRVTDGRACELCTRAAGQRYKREDLMPLHPECGCTVRPILAGKGLRSSPPAPAGEGDLVIAVREHGELGPVLVNAAHAFSEP